MDKYYLIGFFLMITVAVHAQHQEVPEKPDLWRGKQKQTEDSNSLLHSFKTGQMHGHFRYFFMATDNKSGLSDYYANAIGGGIKYETAKLKGFQLGVSGFFVFNLASSDLSKPDPKTNQINRYELGLFDIEDPNNKSDIDRLEELYLKYSWKQSQFTVGKQIINTPFINLQDGRMRPTEVGGVYGEINEIKNTRIEGGYLYEISPRSTVKWYKAATSIGVFPQGVNALGIKSDYAGNLRSEGVFLLGLTHKLKQGLNLKVYELFVENIFNALLLQADYVRPMKNKNKVVAGIQVIRQDAVKDGGNSDPLKSYMDKDAKAIVFGAKLGWENKHWQTSLNFTRITNDGRYLIPREWGRDPFFTFLPRERNEGYGDLNAYVLKFGYDFSKIRLKAQAGIGYFGLPDVTNYRLNKYGMPSYSQVNIDLRHEFTGFFKGVEAQLLMVYKGESGNTYGNDKYVINKVDTKLWNLVINYHF